MTGPYQDTADSDLGKVCFMTEKNVTFTAGELKSHLAHIPDDTILIFENGLTFDRITTRGTNLEQIEFKERFLVLEDVHIPIHSDDR